MDLFPEPSLAGPVVRSVQTADGKEAEGDLDSSEWMRFLLRDISLQMGELAAQAEEALEVAREENGPFVYEPMLMNDVSRLKKIRKQQLPALMRLFYHCSIRTDL